MEITLEKIELVKDRTGVTYKEAKEALEAADGNVVDAIIAIEDTIDESGAKKFGEQGEILLAKMKEIVKKGNVSKIQVSHDDETLINIPLNVGILGTVIAPWGVIIGVIAAFGFKCKIEFVKDDGTVIDVTDKAGDIYEDAKEKGTEIYGVAKEKAPEYYGVAREKGGAAFAKAKDAAMDAADKIKDRKSNDVDADDIEICDKDCEDCKEPCEDKCDDCKFDELHQED